MIDSGPVQNKQSTLSNKFEKLFISLAFIIRIQHDARSSECQKKKYIYIYILKLIYLVYLFSYFCNFSIRTAP
jgi:hypothetical protein